jgi:hypothetical protein
MQLTLLRLLCLQVYPENATQAEMMVAAAMKVRQGVQISALHAGVIAPVFVAYTRMCSTCSCVGSKPNSGWLSPSSTNVRHLHIFGISRLAPLLDHIQRL